ncbi:hypothetical protein [Lysobacter gummosus]|uniref:hypothetical protein n=1 Tax=Lysobacter gummosus TaxID=262324 RepID=UPI00362DA0A9
MPQASPAPTDGRRPGPRTAGAVSGVNSAGIGCSGIGDRLKSAKAALSIPARESRIPALEECNGS